MNLKEMYVKAINMKMYLALYFMAFVFFYSILSIVHGLKQIDILVLLYMVIASFIIALLQVILIPDDYYIKKNLFIYRSIVWFILSILTIYIASYWGKWFISMPSYSIYVFSICSAIGFLAMLIAIHFLQGIDTMRLNKALQQYRNK